MKSLDSEIVTLMLIIIVACIVIMIAKLYEIAHYLELMVS